jgi:hypothetical protein
VGEKGSRDTTTANVDALFETILKDFQTLDYFPQLPKYQNFYVSISNEINGILLYLETVINT